MAAFRKRPVVVEAHRWDGDYDALSAWVTNIVGPRSMENFSFLPTVDGLVINTLEGPMHCPVGHVVIRGVAGEFYACDPEIFDATYEPVTREGQMTDEGSRL